MESGPGVIIEVKSDSVYIVKSRREQKVMHRDKVKLCESRKLQKLLVDFQGAKDQGTSNLSQSSKNNGNLRGRPTKLQFLTVKLEVLEVKTKAVPPLEPSHKRPTNEGKTRRHYCPCKLVNLKRIPVQFLHVTGICWEDSDVQGKSTPCRQMSSDVHCAESSSQ